MAINDDWTLRRTMADLQYTVLTVALDTGKTYALAAFEYRADAEAWATDNAAVVGRDWGIAVQRNWDEFVTWTSF